MLLMYDICMFLYYFVVVSFLFLSTIKGFLFYLLYNYILLYPYFMCISYLFISQITLLIHSYLLILCLKYNNYYFNIDKLYYLNIKINTYEGR